jgi:hypothetical protein
MTAAAAAAAAAMAIRLGVGLDEQQVVSLGTRHLPPRKCQVRLSMPRASSSSSSPRGSNVESATNWGIGRKIAVQVSTPPNVPENKKNWMSAFRNIFFHTSM